LASVIDPAELGSRHHRVGGHGTTTAVERFRLHSMRPRDGEFGLRLAAKAADRQKAAMREWPAFEARLKQLGYSPRAIAHAFRALSGPGTVEEALEALKHADL
jgi:hypothetical protein